MENIIKDIKIKRLILKNSVPFYRVHNIGISKFHKKISQFFNCDVHDLREYQVDPTYNYKNGHVNDPVLEFFIDKTKKGLFFERYLYTSEYFDIHQNDEKLEYYRSYIIKYISKQHTESFIFNINMLSKEIIN
jgi:hypothetical protein